MSNREDDEKAAVLVRAELTSVWKNGFSDLFNIALIDDDAKAFRDLLERTSLVCFSSKIDVEFRIMRCAVKNGATFNRLDMLTAYYRDFKAGRFFMSEDGGTTVFTELISIVRYERFYTNDEELLGLIANIEAVVRHLKVELQLPLVTTLRFSMIPCWHSNERLPLIQLAHHVWPAFIAFAPYFTPEDTAGAFYEFWSDPFFNQRKCQILLAQRLLPYASDADLLKTRLELRTNYADEDDTETRAPVYALVQKERIRRRAEFMKYLVLKDDRVKMHWQLSVMSYRELGQLIADYAFNDRLGPV